MQVYVLYYVPRGAIAEDVELLGAYETREGAEYAYDIALKDLCCAKHELRIDRLAVGD